MNQQKQNISVASLKHQISKQSTISSRCQKTLKQASRCTTEHCRQEPLQDHLVSKDSITHTFVSGAFASIQNDIDWQPQTNKENTYTQPKSCSRTKSQRKHDISYDATPTNIAGKKNSTEAGNYLLNQLKLIVKSKSRFNQRRIAYLDYLEVLRQFNMIQHNYEPKKKDSVGELWDILTTGKQNYTCLINLAIMLLAIMKVKVKISTIKEFFGSACCSAEEQKPSHATKKVAGKEYKRTKDGLLDLANQDLADIYSSFKELRVTRMYLGRIGKKTDMLEERLEKHSRHSFRPHVSQRSKSLAKKKKLKDVSARHLASIEPTEPIHCLTEREAQEEEHCTFQPLTTRNYIEHPLSPCVGVRRTQLLYDLSKRKSREKKDRHPDEVQMEKNRESYTFKPSKMPFISRKSLQNKQRVQGEEKEINRMMKARLQRQVIETAVNKGIPYNLKEMTKIRRKITEDMVQQLFSKKGRLQEDMERIKQTFISPSVTQLQNNTELLVSQEKKDEASPPAAQQQQLKSQKTSHPASAQQSQKNTPLNDSKARQRQQLFTFEVFIEEDVCLDKITLCQGDSPEELASEFVLRHGLAPEMQGKLVKALYAHLLQLIERNQLGCIDEESIEYSLDVV